MKKQLGLRMAAIVAAVIAVQAAALAATPDEVRGGWIADIDGQRHILLLNVRGADVN